MATFVEMKSRFYVALPMKDRTRESMLEAMKDLIKPLPKPASKSFISNRGKEFACYKEIENLGIDIYFADHIQLGKEEVKKIKMVYLESIILRKLIYLKSMLKI